MSQRTLGSPRAPLNRNLEYISAPERAINDHSEDQLGRTNFVKRLTDAVISKHNKQATGITIGITGPWGSGKSSILNLLANHVKDVYSDAIVVRFDPWLISGRNDLISEFIAELIATLQQKPNGKKRFKSLISKFAGYGQTLSPLAAVIPHSGPWAGALIASGLKQLKDRIDRKKSLFDQRRELNEALAQLSTAIIVLIDELDRIDDEEIRTIAQLIRAVADFRGISYILAYDTERVVRALSASVTELERGRAYLEKIVQLQIPLPLLLDEEIYALMEADFDILCNEGRIPDKRADIERYVGLRNILVPHLVSTPRDVKRLVGTFSTLIRMLEREVDWIDLLGYSAILIKAPLTAEKIKLSPDILVEDPSSIREIANRMSGQKAEKDRLIERINPNNEGGEALRRLLTFLFPRLSDDPADRRYDQDRHGTSLSKSQPLLTTLRLDLVPGLFSLSEVLELFQHSPSEIKAFLEANFKANRLAALLGKIKDSNNEIGAVGQMFFWQGVSEFLRKPDTEYLTAAPQMHDLADEFSRLLFRIGGKKTKSIFSELLDRGDVEITQPMLRSHIFHYGLFGRRASHRPESFLDESGAEAIIKRTAASHRREHLNGRFLWSLWNFYPIYNMVDAGVWDEECREALLKFLSDDPGAVDTFTMMLFGPHYMTGHDFISKVVDLDAYLAAVDRRLSASNLHQSLMLALEKAKNPIM